MKDSSEIVFEVTQEGNGGFVAECLNEDIITQADTWQELRQNVKKAVCRVPNDSARAVTGPLQRESHQDRGVAACVSRLDCV